MHVFVVDIFLRVLTTVGVLLLGGFLYYFMPYILSLFFRRVTGLERDIRHVLRNYRNRLEYVEVSYWRTSFFLLVYWLVRITLLVATLFVAFWIWHQDLWYVVLGLGVYGLVITFHASDYVRNMVAHLWILSSGMVKLGQQISVGGTEGIVIGLTSMHVVVCDPVVLQTQDASTIGQFSHAAFAATMQAPRRTTPNETSAPQHPGIHFVPNGNIMAYTTSTTDVHHYFPDIADARAHGA